MRFENDCPLFSIVMPVYNVERYLDECVNSILNQTYTDFELIMVDDGSTDGCYEKCEAYCQKDKRCRVIHQENKGLLLARRAGIKTAIGRYLVNVDSDDKCELKLLECLKEVIDETNADMIIYNYYFMYEDGRLEVNHTGWNKNAQLLKKEELIKQFINTVDYNLMWIKCSKMSIVDKNVDYSSYGRLNMAEDQLQSAALFEKANVIYTLNMPLYYYRYNNLSITKKANANHIVDSLKAKNRVYKMLENLNCSKELYDLFYQRYFRTINHYILRNLSRITLSKDYKIYIQTIQRYIIFDCRKAKMIDRIIYKILFSNCFLLIKIVGRAYKQSK